MLQTGNHPTASSCRRMHRAGVLLVMVVLASVPAQGEDGHEAWLRYAPLHDGAARESLAALPAVVVRLDESLVTTAAQGELIRGVRGMLGRALRVETRVPEESAIILGTSAALEKANAGLRLAPPLKPDGYGQNQAPSVVLKGSHPDGDTPFGS